MAVWWSSGERAAATQLVLLPSCQREPRRGAFMEGHRRLSYDGREHVGRGVGPHVQPVSAPRLTPARPRRDRSRGAGLMPKGSRPHDPMRELDLLHLEDLLMRRNCEPTASHRTLQTMCILLVFGGGSRICLPLMHPDPGTTAQSQFKHSSSAVSWESPFHDHDHVIIDHARKTTCERLDVTIPEGRSATKDPQRLQINHPSYSKLSTSNVEISSDAYVAVWMRLVFQQRASVRSSGGRFSPDA